MRSKAAWATTQMSFGSVAVSACHILTIVASRLSSIRIASSSSGTCDSEKSFVGPSKTYQMLLLDLYWGPKKQWKVTNKTSMSSSASSHCESVNQ